MKVVFVSTSEERPGVPAEPIVFVKALSSLGGPDDDVLIPRGAEKVDWKVELGVVIGKRASSVGEVDALDHVAGFTPILQWLTSHSRGAPT